jgi:hypothetical protein
MTTPAITILSYVAESGVVYAPYGKPIESCHRRIWRYFCNGDVLKARTKACQRVQKEMERFNTAIGDSADEGSPYEGLMLYFTYRLNDARKGKKDKVYRYYLLDGDPLSRTEQLARMEQEALFLADAGLILKRAEVEDGVWSVFSVAKDVI